LRADLDSGVFSFVSIDGDRTDAVRVVKQAAQAGRICGRFFISSPDFELGDFTLEELEEVIWGMVEEHGPRPEGRDKLRRKIRGAKGAEELIERAKEALPGYSKVLFKSERCGRRLMEYAWKHPTWSGNEPLGSDEKKNRPIIEAVYQALTARKSNYPLTREHYRVDLESGELVEREEPQGT
jgi:hypothetical protein